MTLIGEGKILLADDLWAVIEPLFPPRRTVRYERREDIHLAFVQRGYALVTFNQLQRSC